MGADNLNNALEKYRGFDERKYGFRVGIGALRTLQKPTILAGQIQNRRRRGGHWGGGLARGDPACQMDATR